MECAVECYFTQPSPDVPNNRLPVLIYRNVLPRPLTEETATACLSSHKWEKRGTWGHISIRHFHPNSHECYGVFQGSSTLLIGAIDTDVGRGCQVSLQAGDVIVLPAGTAHSSLSSSDDYRYIGVYPNVLAGRAHDAVCKGCPKWTNEVGDNPAHSFKETVRRVGFPEEDPVYGIDGPLMRLWHPLVLAKL
ncbi:hypothetical protein Micbo1qcDRAFT_223794 [Microdochium bolleyi]|uniref:Cupin type-1 domain-containing protein n=1 Tax=Microdochium bolleyi TaxID=196109 RepID=A0A136J3X4_9PEZI|nr:hypothetical protein Micbo1qcDRAFT_223794 [Microdochium bolleyi]